MSQYRHRRATQQSAPTSSEHVTLLYGLRPVPAINGGFLRSTYCELRCPCVFSSIYSNLSSHGQSIHNPSGCLAIKSRGVSDGGRMIQANGGFLSQYIGFFGEFNALLHFLWFRLTLPSYYPRFLTFAVLS